MTFVDPQLVWAPDGTQLFWSDGTPVYWLVVPTIPVVSVNPSSESISFGTNAEFSASAVGIFSVQWQVSANNGSAWTNTTDGASYSGSTTDTLTVLDPPLNWTGYQFRAVFTNPAGSATTTAATLVVTYNGNVVFGNAPMQALLGGVRDCLQQAFSPNLTTANCDVQDEGQPPPFAGQYYVAVWPGAFRNTDDNPLSLDEYYGVNVTVTYRTDVLPADRIGSNVYLGNPAPDDATPIPNFYQIINTIRAVVHGNYNVLNLAGGTTSATVTTWLGGQSYSLIAAVQGFAEPLKFSTCTQPERCSPDWFWSEGQEMAPSGIKVTLSFVNARLVQEIADNPFA